MDTPGAIKCRYRTVLRVLAVLVPVLAVFPALGPSTSAQDRVVPEKRIRVDPGTGLVRANFSIRNERLKPGREFWRETSAAFGWSDTATDLQKIRDVRYGAVRHETWQQQVKGLPLIDAYVRVSIAGASEAQNQTGEHVSSVMSAYQPVVGADELVTAPQVAPAEAVRTAVRGLGESHTVRTAEPGLAVLGGDALRLVWQVTAWPHAEPSEWRILVDAQTGRVLDRRDMALRHRTTIDGQGLVFDPSPLMTAGAAYGAPYVDASDASNPVLTAELQEVVLRDLDVDNQGNIRLEGPFVRITGELAGGGASSYVPPVVSDPAAFRLDRDAVDFEAVMSYYHIDKSQRYVQQLGFRGLQEGPLAVNPRGITRDESFYFPSGNLIVFGTGGVDDGEDATVIWHEYAHALLEAASPGLNTSLEGTAVHEGWADYWAVSYQRFLVESGQAARGDWETLFAWDSGDGVFWPGRVMDFAGTYPQDTCSDQRPAPTGCSPHNDGRLLATALMEVQGELGRETTDQLVLFSHAYLTAPVTFRDAGEAILQADLDHFGGDHAGVLAQILGSRGLLSDASLLPLVEHDPVAGSDDLGGELPIDVRAVGVGAAVDQVTVFAESSSQGVFSESLSRAGDETWTGTLTLPSVPDSLFYYLSVTDSEGRIRMLPDGAPGVRFGLLVGLDTVGPTVAHTAIEAGSMATWPERVEATVTDNFSVGDVRVDFLVEDADGAALDSGTFQLVDVGSRFEGLFPSSLTEIEKGATVSYRIRASDASAGKNETVTPADGWFTFTIVAEGLVRSFALTSEAVTPTSAWQVAPAGDAGGAVPAGSDVAWIEEGSQVAGSASHVIDTTPINLRRQTGPPLLTFWYRSRFDASGAQSAGANVKIRTAQGGPWVVAQPLSGYPSVLARPGHFMNGEGVFAADTYGWRFAAVELPPEKEVSVRIELAAGSDDLLQDNEFRVAGIEITTLVPGDIQAPVILSASHLERVAIRDVPDQGRVADDMTLTLETFDDMGVQEATAQVTLPDGSQQVVPLRQDATVLTRYTGTIGRPDLAVPGAEVTFTATARDWSGQTVTWPASGGPLSATYVLSDASDLLAGAVSAAGWSAAPLWQITSGDAAGFAASLSTRPLFVPQNAERVLLRMRHDYVLTNGHGATVQVSSSDGGTWTTLEPEGGYPGVMTLDASHPWAGVRGFRDAEAATEDVFDVSEFRGEEVLIRLLFATEPGTSGASSWRVAALDLESETQESEFAVSTRFSLNTVYPNPVRSTLVVTYSLEEAGVVELELYDTLGRRVARLDGGVRNAGSHSVTYSASGLAGGMYVVRLRAGSQSESRTVVKL